MHFLLIPIYHLVNFLLFSFLFLNPLYGQTLDDILQSVQIEEDGDLLTDDELLILEELVHQPIELNEASRNDLESIPLFTPTDITLILEKKRQIGGFSSMEQVVIIPGLSPFANQLLPLVVTIRHTTPLNVNLRNRWVTSGNDVRFLTQTSLRHDKISGGFLLERDPKEPTLSDFGSGYFSIKLREGNRLILGDYQIINGFGLLFGRSAGTMKGQLTISRLAKPGSGLMPYRSAMESWALRGFAFETINQLGKWTVSFSTSPKDATIDSNNVVSLSMSGLHQTSTTKSRKHNLKENLAIVQWKNNFNHLGQVGILFAKDHWKIDRIRPKNREDRIYGSLYFRTSISSLNIFGEMASYTGEKTSFLAGTILTQNPLQWILSFRFYPNGFQGPRSQPLREWSSYQLNEMGLFQGILLKMGNHQIYTYGDIYHQTGVKRPSQKAIKGFEMVGIWNYKWNNHKLSFRWKREEKAGGNDITYIQEVADPKVNHNNLRMNLTLQLSSHSRLQLQGDQTKVFETDTTYRGYGLSTKIIVNHKKYKMIGHWVGFIADDYPSRIYIWDTNLPGELRTKAFFPTGQSIAIFLKIKTNTGANLSARLRSTWEFSRYDGNWSIPELEGGFQMDIAF